MGILRITQQLLLLFIPVSICQKSCSDSICVPEDYKKDVTPSINKPCTIEANFNFIRILKVNDRDSTITLSLELNLKWRDDRLIFSKNITQSLIKLPPSIQNALWIPDIFIFGLHRVNQLELTQKFVYMYQANATDLVFTDAFEIDMFCNMTFKYFPFDSQNCDFLITSYSSTDTDILFKFNSIDFQINDQISHLKYHIVDIQPVKEFKSEFLEANGSRGNWSITGFSVSLSRKKMKYIVDYFMPSGLLVIISWVRNNLSFQHSNFEA